MHMVAEESLLREALGLDSGTPIRLMSREPLGAGAIAGFTVRGAGQPVVTYFVDTSRRAVPRETGVLQGTPERPEVRVWAHPSDPHLPALAPVAFAQGADALLRRLGVPADAGLTLVGYRAGRRAVLRAGDAEPVWIKVVPPRRVSRIVDTHAQLASQGLPVPAVRGWADEGLIVLDHARGVPAAQAHWDPADLIDRLDVLRERWASAALSHPSGARLPDRFVWYRARLRDVLAGDAARLAEQILSAGGGLADQPTTETSVHGDLHLGQLFWQGDDVAAVIDVDTAGRGEPGDDVAAFLAHAVTTALTGRDLTRMVGVADAVRRRWLVGDARERTLTLLLGHALGAFETGEPDRGLRILRVARVVGDPDQDEKTLMKALGAP
ncbi:MAG: hypothetical protein ACK5LN_04130 [Propioniciclava sp.]